MKRMLILGLIASFATIGVALAPSSGARATNKVRTCRGGTILLKKKELAILKLHNRTRKELGLSRVCVSRSLTRAARFHSREEIRNDYYAHCSKNKGGACYEQWYERVRRFGYSGSYCCPENLHIGWGSYAAPLRIFDDWVDSPGHWENIRDPNVREIGVGTYRGTWKGQPKTTAYSVDFGRR